MPYVFYCSNNKQKYAFSNKALFCYITIGSNMSLVHVYIMHWCIIHSYVYIALCCFLYKSLCCAILTFLYVIIGTPGSFYPLILEKLLSIKNRNNVASYFVANNQYMFINQTNIFCWYIVLQSGMHLFICMSVLSYCCIHIYYNFLTFCDVICIFQYV